MPANHSEILGIMLSFVLAGIVKGVTGMGLPTVAMGLLSLVMPPVEAAAFLIIPSAVTNLWQFFAGRNRLMLARRMAPMLVMICVSTCMAAGLIAGNHGGYASAALGAALLVYAGVALANIRLSVSKRSERWLSPVVGTATGIVTGATGVFVIPAVPYLQALGFGKDDLVQALGLSFTLSTFALAAGLASRGAFHLGAAGASTLCTLPALAGMTLGQFIRARANPTTFRLIFLIGLLVLGLDLIVRSGVVSALKDERGGTAQTRYICVPGSHHPWRSSRDGELSHRLVENRTIAVPGRSDVTDDIDNARRERCNDEAQSVTDLVSLFFYGLRRV